MRTGSGSTLISDGRPPPMKAKPTSSTLPIPVRRRIAMFAGSGHSSARRQSEHHDGHVVMLRVTMRGSETPTGMASELARTFSRPDCCFVGIRPAPRASGAPVQDVTEMTQAARDPVRSNQAFATLCRVTFERSLG